MNILGLIVYALMALSGLVYKCAKKEGLAK